MTFRVLAACLLASSLGTLGACVPRESDPNVSDLDGDGVVDARDKCMADPEDFDGCEDSDGCAEPAGPPECRGDDDQPVEHRDPVVATPTVKTQKATLARNEKRAFAKRQVDARIAPFRKSAWGASVDDRERGAVIFGFGKSWIESGSKSTKVPGDAYRAQFSSDGTTVALVGAREFLIYDTKRGKKVRSFPYAKGTSGSPETKLIRLRADGSLLLFDGCQLRSGRLDSNVTTPIGDSHCGARPLSSDDGSRWYAWQQEDDGQVAVHEIDTKTGTPTAVLGGTGDAPGLSLLIPSPDGRFLCFSRHKNGSRFTCRDVESSTDMEVWAGPTDTRAAFASNGALGFAAGAIRSEREFFVADLERRTLRHIGMLGPKEEWINAVGERGFVASGGKRLLHFDLESQKQTEISLGDGEWEGFAAIPGTPNEFIVGRERKATRDLYRITVP